MLTDNAIVLVQTLQNDVDQLEKDLVDWLKSQKVRPKKIPGHYIHIIHPIQAALSQLINPDMDIVASGKPIQSIFNSAGGFFHLFEGMESVLDAKMPDTFFTLKDKIFKNAVALKNWYDAYPKT